MFDEPSSADDEPEEVFEVFSVRDVSSHAVGSGSVAEPFENAS